MSSTLGQGGERSLVNLNTEHRSDVPGQTGYTWGNTVEHGVVNSEILQDEGPLLTSDLNSWLLESREDLETHPNLTSVTGAYFLLQFVYIGLHLGDFAFSLESPIHKPSKGRL